MKIRRRYNKTPSRRRIPGTGAETYRGSRTPIHIVSIQITPPGYVVIFDQPVILKGIPQYAESGGDLPTAAELTGGVTLALTYPAPPVDPMTVPFEDPGVRNGAGGYVTEGDYSEPA